jgi:tripartite-type tricarboxylate transporter receptor subunit TctC
MRRLAAVVIAGALAGALMTGHPAGATTEPPTSEADATVPEAPPPDRLDIMAPADPGGGWDSTARAMQTVLDPMIEGAVEVANVPGAGGTIGLAEFAGQAGSGSDLMVMGSVMVGAIGVTSPSVTGESLVMIAPTITEPMTIMSEPEPA